MLRRKRQHFFARICVVGLGGGGVTAVNQMMANNVSGVNFVVVDSDPEALNRSRAPTRIHVSSGERSGAAASKAHPLLREALAGADMVFLIGGLGGRTGTFLAPAVAALAREQQALVIAIMTCPFAFEGAKRTQRARVGVEQLRKWATTLVVVPNDRLLETAGGELSFHETYRLANDVWQQSIEGINELVNSYGLVNVDFADIRTVMGMGGASLIATGRGCGPQRAQVAASAATHSSLLGITIDGARALVFNISGGPDMGLHEVEEAAAIIRERAHPAAYVIFGATINFSLEDEIAITVIATGCGWEAPRLRPPARAVAQLEPVVPLLGQPGG
jgi:cell division protein FtsZ